VPVGVRSTAVRVVTFCKAVPVGVCCTAVPVDIVCIAAPVGLACTTVPVEVVCMAEVGVIALDCAQPGTVRHKMAPNV
jgi:hypothetical protein